MMSHVYHCPSFRQLRRLGRQKDRQARPDTDFATDLDLAAALLNDPMNDGQPESGSLADFFGREKGLEDLGDYLVGHAVTCIRDRDVHIATWLQAIIDSLSMPGNFQIAGSDRERSAVGHGITGIDNKIHKDLVQLTAVDPHRSQLELALEDDFNLIAGQSTEKIL